MRELLITRNKINVVRAYRIYRILIYVNLYNKLPEVEINLKIVLKQNYVNKLLF